MAGSSDIRPVNWKSGSVVWINQRKIPWKEEWRSTTSISILAKAIKTLEIRGAPAIGVAAGFGVAMSAWNSKGSIGTVYSRTVKEAKFLREARPTAVNLAWAVDRMLVRAKGLRDGGVTVDGFRNGLLKEALDIQREDLDANMRMGRHGSALIRDGDVILTHCNAGALATAGYGTSYSVITTAWKQGKKIRVIATQTAPLYQGARLTVWELTKDRIPVTLITDSMAAYAMENAGVTKVILGADRILLDGSVANKIGTYGLAIIAKHNGIPFYVAAPTSTVDPKGRSIPIEMRPPDEVRKLLGKLQVTVKDVPVLNPAFDITPPELVSAIITENGIAKRPYKTSLTRLLKKGKA